MNAEGWRNALVSAFDRVLNHNDATALMGLAAQLAEEDEAKQLLRDAGFGVTGTSLLLSVREVLRWVEDRSE